jgi:hypothetical protein
MVIWVNWKALLAVFIAVGILGLLFATDIGNKYAQFLGAKVGSFLSAILNIDLGGGGESFRVLLTADKNAFYGQSYEVSNSSLRASGVCQSSVTVGSTVMQIGGQRCSIEAQKAQGRFEYTASGSVRFAGTSEGLVVNDYPFLSTGKSFAVSFEVIPTDGFSLSDLSQSKIQLSSVTGSIESWKGETRLSIDNLVSSLTISNFIGDISLDGNTITLIGLASSVSGKDFSW